MRILVTGAYGFIGSHLTAWLAASGHEVVGCGRDLALGRRMFPDLDWIACDFNRDISAASWAPRLNGIDAVVNCAGILQASRTDDIESIHHHAPAALFEACAAAGVRRVVHVSALGADEAAGTAYARSKKAAEDHLAGLDLSWVVLRPSLVHARSCYGGTAMFRALAAFPLVVPVPGDGGQRFQPIHMADLVRAIGRLLEPDAPSRIVLEPVGPEPMTLRQIVLFLRRWLGFGHAPLVPVPMPLVRVAAWCGDLLHWLGYRGSLRSTSLRQMEYGNTADVAPFVEAVGFSPRPFAMALAAEPAGLQDRWHARLVLLRPLLRVTLALFWIASGLLAAFEPGRSQALTLLSAAGLPPAAAIAALWGGVVADIVLGTILLARIWVQLAAAGMVAVSLAYLAAATLAAPGLWADPLGPLLKVVPLIPAILVVAALEDDR